MAWLVFLVLGFVLFGAFAWVHGKLLGLGRRTLKDIAVELDRALERWEELQPLWSGGSPERAALARGFFDNRLEALALERGPT